MKPKRVDRTNAERQRRYIAKLKTVKAEYMDAERITELWKLIELWNFYKFHKENIEAIPRILDAILTSPAIRPNSKHAIIESFRNPGKEKK
jgi:hypothetical protein